MTAVAQPAVGVALRAILRAATARLAAAGVPSPRHDAEELAACLLGVPRRLLPLAAALDLAAYELLVDRRAAREPLQHLTGQAPFRYLVLAVGPGVFIPRPETEALVDLILPAVGDGSLAVDLCAGSGALALSVATECPGSRVHAVEADPGALPWLERNCSDRVTVHPAAAADCRLLGVDVVVSNPPYLPDGLPLEPEVSRYDPPAALWGGPDGLRVVAEVVNAAAGMLRPGGLLALEHDASHQADVLKLLRGSGFQEVMGHRDLSGRDRYATARR